MLINQLKNGYICKLKTIKKILKMKRFYSVLTRALVFSLIMAIPLTFYAQDGGTTTKKEKKSSSFSPYLFLSGDVGLACFRGDVSTFPGFNKANINGTLNLGYQFLPWLKAYGTVGRGFMGGEATGLVRRHTTAPTYDLYFDMDYYEADLQLGLNLSNLIGGYKDRFFSFGIHGGFGQNQYKARTYYTSNDKRYATSGFKGQTGSRSGNGLNGRKVVLTVPVGVDLNFKASEKIDIYADWTGDWMQTDYADNFYSGDKVFKNDTYGHFNVGLRYNFKKAGPNKMAKDFNKIDLATSPNPLAKKGDSVEVTIKGTFPPKYFNKGVVMNFAPVLKYEGGEKVFPAKNYKGEEASCDGEMVSYKNGGSFVYTAKVPYEPGMEASELVVEPVFYTCDGETYANGDDALANAKKAVKAESRKVADGVIVTDELVQHNEVVAYAPDGYEKVTISTQESSLYFPKNRANIKWSLALNKNSDNYNALKNNTSDVAKGWEIKDITIDGWASPEGEETFNEGLSQHRAEAAAKYMKRKLKKAKVAFTDETFVLNGNGPDWNGFMNAVKASNLKDKNAIINVVNSADESKKEEEIRNMILIYPELERDILPPLRRAAISVNTFVPKKTDAEIAQLATSDYSKLDINELLYAATLTEDLNVKKQIYANAMQAFPKCWRAVVNAAGVELALGNNDEALSLLMKVKENDKAHDAWEFRNNMGIAQFRKGDVKHAYGCFSKAQELGGDESYNLGVVNIAKGDYATAVSDLSGAKCDYNLALAQVLNEDYAGADKTLACAEKTADVYYLMAVSAARQDNKSAMLSNLGQAVKANANLKAAAAKDRSFLKYFGDADFEALVK